MQINDDTIRQVFAWPVRYDDENMQVVDLNGDTIVNIVERSYDADALGETIAAMLNERYAPKPEQPKMENHCAICGMRYGLHSQGQDKCPRHDLTGYHPTNRFTPKGGR